LRIISYRPRSEAEVRARLLRKFPEPVVADVLVSLTAHGLLDDARFARQWADGRDSRSPRSAWAVNRELLAKGVDEAVAHRAIQDIDDDDGAYRAGLKYARVSTRIDLPTFRRRLLAYLRRRGFSQSVSRRTIDRLTAERSGPAE
jgi:regulatory protein